MQTCGRDIASVVADLRRVVYEQVKLQPGMSLSYSAVIIAGLCRHALSRRRRLPSIDCTGLMLLEGFGIFTFEKCSFPETAKLIHRMPTGRSVRNRTALPTISKSTE
jgi:hypothetical protein